MVGDAFIIPVVVFPVSSWFTQTSPADQYDSCQKAVGGDSFMQREYACNCGFKITRLGLGFATTCCE